MTILAATIEYDDDGTTRQIGVTDGDHTNTTGITLEGGLWYPALSSDVQWSEQARHIYQEQGGELIVGDLVISNHSGIFDFLVDADIVGMKCELRRGEPDTAWDDMEFVFKARIAGRRFEGYSIVIDLENWLAKLSGPVYDEVFGSDVPNPQLAGKQIPYVLGKVTQAPVLEFDPNNLTYYTAANCSLIGEVAEGGNPTQKWALADQPTFDLLRSPTLPITATFEGPSDTDWAVIIDDDLDTWVSGSDSSLTSPYTNQGDKPSGWTLIVGNSMPPISVTVTQSSGMRINDLSGAMNTESTESSVTTIDGTSVPVGSSSVPWTNAAQAVRDDSGSADIDTGAGKTDAIRVTVDNFRSAGMAIQTNHTINSGEPVLGSASFVYSDEFLYTEQLNRLLPSISYSTFLRPWEFINPDELGESCEFQIKLRDDYVSDFSLDDFYVYGFYATEPSVHLRRDLSLTDGQVYSAQIEGTTAEEVSFLFGASNSTEVDWPDHADYLKFINNGCANEISSDFSVSSTFTASGSVFNLSYQPAFGNVREFSNGRFGDVTITRIKITEQSGGNKSYKTLAPTAIEEVGYTSAEYDQDAFDAHADAYGDPELGWLVKGNETADQVLFRMAGSLFGYVWHGLDGKVRSKRLVAPTAVDDPFVIDSARTDPRDVIAYDDRAPNLRRPVNALRNWKPLDLDSTAGITTTWTEEERAKVTQDWRITRDWQATSSEAKTEFSRRWPNVASREPLATALRDEITCQLIANEGADTWIDRPMFFEMPVYVDVGELSKVAVGETVKCELDYPGLEDDWLLVLGRSGGGKPGIVNLVLWSAKQLPLILKSQSRDDPRLQETSSGEYFIDGDDFDTIWNQGPGTIVAEVTPSSTSDTLILDVSDGTSDNRITIQAGSGIYRARVVTGGTIQASVGGGTVATGVAARIAITFEDDGFNLYINGVHQGSDSVLTLPAVSQAEWGADLTHEYTAYYPTALSQDQAEQASEIGSDLVKDKV